MDKEWIRLLGGISNYRKTDKFSTDYDARSRFKKDFDKIVNSASFRRLQDKAQIFPIEKNDFSRRRLTHSIEAMAIAESIGLYLADLIIKQDQLVDSDEIKLINDIPMILKSACLIHDLGNPPFGHITEKILSIYFLENKDTLCIDNNLQLHNGRCGEDCFKISELLGIYYEDFVNFDGNAQSLRIVDKLSPAGSIIENRKYGMDLSQVLLATIIKYPLKWKKEGKSKKLPFFRSEIKKYNSIQNELRLNDSRHPLTYILETADDIAYHISDLQDSIKKKLVTIEDLVYELEDIQHTSDDDLTVSKVLSLIERAKSDYKDTYNGGLTNESYDDFVFEEIRGYLCGYLIEEAQNELSNKNTYNMLKNNKFDKETLLHKNSNLFYALSNILRKKVYYCDDIVKSKIRATAVINTLIEFYLKSIFNYDKSKNSKNEDIYSLGYLSISKSLRDVCNDAINNTDKFAAIDKIDEVYLKIKKEIINNKYRIESILSSKNKGLISVFYQGVEYLLGPKEYEYFNQSLIQKHELDRTLKKIDFQRKYSHEIYCKIQLAIDHVTGMTDNYALARYNEIMAI